MTITAIPYKQFFEEVFKKTNRQTASKIDPDILSPNDRGNVLEIKIAHIRGCHYEIGFHRGCHEIALHFQGTSANNASRLDGFRPYQKKIQAALGHPVILGPHENQGRTRLWIKLPVSPCTETLVETYSDLTARLIIETFPILQSILEEESQSKR
jgi:hypothetical protein